jgi:hypothetical protein
VGNVVALSRAIQQRYETACVYGAELKNHYILGNASDKGKEYATLADAMKVCSTDVSCGGVLSRDCDQNDQNCKAFQTRSGMSKSSTTPHALPEPSPQCPSTNGDNCQNSYLITNAKKCGHHG